MRLTICVIRVFKFRSKVAKGLLLCGGETAELG